MPRKPRPEGTRRPNGASSIYFGKDGKWHGRVTVGVKDDGKPDRRHVERKTEAEVIEAVRELEKLRDSGKVQKPGQNKWTVEKWLTHWVENIAPLTGRYKTVVGYRTAVYRHLIPGLGSHRMKRVEPDHFEKLYTKMIAAGAKPATAHQVHRTARTAFGVAEDRGIITRNPVSKAKAPRVEEDEVEPYEADEIGKLLAAALSRRNGVRFVLALVLGTRQGETIGFKWERLDRKKRKLRASKQLQRQTWKHGCDDPNTCGAKYHKVNPCKESCKRHKRKPCPPPCPPDCTSHARWCPQRHGGGLVEVDVKSKAGRRGFVLPDRLYDLLMAHEEQQAKEREHAGTEWHEGGWMFAQPNGNPIDPRRDLDEWKELLREAGVREGRLHDARHTAATVLLLLGVPERAVMELMGWSNSSQAKRYQHVTASLRTDIADQLNGFFWGTN
ncbi:tyrosine-type recombinase/integrase [Amycolatopsis suaedae]|uniref:Site-specific integrase n=1 Tax=Amycolatopsis suaedae TaxID=2510978 RepID=A0A4Q7JCT2_9PSEU|nr:tyrosine-type recombinase/integrase [Amycolatopsis suaedae]RZQ64373.1 site-specific integrase [Amycolatopsis suaedae]